MVEYVDITFKRQTFLYVASLQYGSITPTKCFVSYNSGQKLRGRYTQEFVDSVLQENVYIPVAVVPQETSMPNMVNQDDFPDSPDILLLLMNDDSLFDLDYDYT